MTVIAALAFLARAAKEPGHKYMAWALALYGIGGLLYTLVHLGAVDNYTTHILESVLVFVAFILLYAQMKVHHGK